MITCTNLQIPGLRAIQVDAERGDVLEFQHPPEDRWADVPYHVIIARGSKRSEASNHPGWSKVVVAGDTNRDVARNVPNNPGTVRQTIESDTYRHYCISDIELRRLTVVVARRDAGDRMTITPPWGLFVGVGTVRVNGGDALQAPVFVQAQNAPAEIEIVEPVVALHIRTP